MAEPVRGIPEGHPCRFRGRFVVTSQQSDPQAEKQNFSGMFHIVSNLDYLLDVPREHSLPVQVAYHNQQSQAFLQGAFVDGYGLLLVDYDSEGKPYLTLAADVLRPQPGDPSTREYVDSSSGMANPTAVFNGTITGIPFD